MVNISSPIRSLSSASAALEGHVAHNGGTDEDGGGSGGGGGWGCDMTEDTGGKGSQRDEVALETVFVDGSGERSLVSEDGVEGAAAVLGTSPLAPDLRLAL